MSDIDDLEQDAQRLKVSWRKAHNYFHSFTKLFFEVRGKFTDGADFGVDKYGVPWNFESWLGFQAGLVESQVLRRIELFGKQLAQDDRDNIARANQEAADKKRQEAAEKRAIKEAAAAEKRAVKEAAAAARKAKKDADAAVKAEEEAEKKRATRRSRTPSGTVNRMSRIANCGYLSQELLDDITHRRLSKTAADEVARAPEGERDALREKFLANKSRRPPVKPPSVKKVDDPLAVEICLGYAEAQRGKDGWVNGTMRAAVGLATARGRYTADREFSQWLKEHQEIPYTDHDRAALIKLGQYPEISRELLETTDRWSFRSIVDHELRPLLEDRFGKVVKPDFGGDTDFPVIH